MQSVAVVMVMVMAYDPGALPLPLSPPHNGWWLSRTVVCQEHTVNNLMPGCWGDKREILLIIVTFCVLCYSIIHVHCVYVCMCVSVCVCECVYMCVC